MSRIIREADLAEVTEIMQHNILKHGFTYCGIIYLQSGDARLAYQKIYNGLETEISL